MEPPAEPALEETGDAELLRGLRSGDESAWREFEKKTRPRLYRMALTRVDDCSRAEDLVQEALMKLHRDIGSIDNPQAWVTRVLANEARDLQRRNRIRRSLPLDEASQCWPAGRGVSPRFDENRVREEQAKIDRLVKHIASAGTVAIAEVFRLRYVEGMDGPAIALALGISDGAVRNRLHRAKQIARRYLQERPDRA